MPKYLLEFTTTVRGRVTVEAASQEDAEELGESMASDTLNYEELSDNGRHAPDVETEFDDLYELKEQETPNE